MGVSLQGCLEVWFNQQVDHTAIPPLLPDIPYPLLANIEFIIASLLIECD